MTVSTVPNAPALGGPVGASRERLRVAFVAPYLPAPRDSGGRIRMAALAQGLAHAEISVDLFARVYPVELEAPREARAEALGSFARIALFGRSRPSGLPLRDPWRARDALPHVLREALRQAHRAHPYDAVIACHAYAAPALDDVPGAARILDEHNLESRYAQKVLRANVIERIAMARLERRAWRRADLVTCVRDDDREQVAAHARACALVPNGVELETIPLRLPTHRRGRVVLFVGALSHPPNVDACRTLARAVLPRLRQADPEASLVLCGRAPSAEVRALAGPGVKVTGTVASTAPYLEGASVFANAITAGEGTSLKFLEAAAAGLPIVSTTAGARGFAARDGEHLLRAESPEAFVDAILAVWREPAAAEVRARAARALAEAHAWGALAARFAGLVRETVARRARA